MIDEGNKYLQLSYETRKTVDLSQKPLFTSIAATISLPTVLHFKVNLTSKTILENSFPLEKFN